MLSTLPDFVAVWWMTICFQSRAATLGFQRLVPGRRAPVPIPGAGILRLASGAPGIECGGIDAAGGGSAGGCMQPTRISPASSSIVSITLDLEFVTRYVSTASPQVTGIKSFT